ncbi:hypothetical protein B0H34DRAFT_707244 [Crassisporium funariophilum]|nr:hypothetical protein B0H34DRAFT_707244 [Crassisporium funariophilum]
MSPILVFDDTLGAASIGFSVSCVVFGVFTTQVFVYFQRYPLDRPAYKFLVAFLWIIELLDQIFIGYAVYYYTITNYNDPLVLLNGDIFWPLIMQIVMGCLAGTVVKCCFAMRVWRFSKQNILITGVIAILILGQFGLALAYCIRAFELNRLILAPRLRVIASLALGSGLLTDIAIALALCYFLRKLRTGFRKSDSIINMLSIYAVNTGALTGAVGLCTLILYNARPETFFFMASYFTLGKLYAISFLCTLNTRKVIRGRGTDQEGNTSNNTSQARNTFFMVTNDGRAARNNEFSSNAHTKSMEIGIHQEVSVITDLEEAVMDDSVVLGRSKSGAMS